MKAFIGGANSNLRVKGASTSADDDAFTVFSGGTGIDISSGAVSVDSTVVVTSGTQSIGGDKTFANDVIVTGNLTINGTQTTVNTETLTVDDNIIILNNN